jgi:hypothetical protein
VLRRRSIGGDADGTTSAEPGAEVPARPRNASKARPEDVAAAAAEAAAERARQEARAAVMAQRQAAAAAAAAAEAEAAADAAADAEVKARMPELPRPWVKNRALQAQLKDIVAAGLRETLMPHLLRIQVRWVVC